MPSNFERFMKGFLDTGNQILTEKRQKEAEIDAYREKSMVNANNQLNLYRQQSEMISERGKEAAKLQSELRQSEWETRKKDMLEMQQSDKTGSEIDWDVIDKNTMKFQSLGYSEQTAKDMALGHAGIKIPTNVESGITQDFKGKKIGIPDKLQAEYIKRLDIATSTVSQLGDIGIEQGVPASIVAKRNKLFSKSYGPRSDVLDFLTGTLNVSDDLFGTEVRKYARTDEEIANITSMRNKVNRLAATIKTLVSADTSANMTDREYKRLRDNLVPEGTDVNTILKSWMSGDIKVIQALQDLQKRSLEIIDEDTLKLENDDVIGYARGVAEQYTGKVSPSVLGDYDVQEEVKSKTFSTDKSTNTSSAVTINTKEEYDALPSGTRFIDASGNEKIKR